MKLAKPTLSDQIMPVGVAGWLLWFIVAVLLGGPWWLLTLIVFLILLIEVGIYRCQRLKHPLIFGAT